MRYENGLITCDGCGESTAGTLMTCDRVEGEWCTGCFGECPAVSLDKGPCDGEGCPTTVFDMDAVP